MAETIRRNLYLTKANWQWLLKESPYGNMTTTLNYLVARERDGQQFIEHLAQKIEERQHAN